MKISITTIPHFDRQLIRVSKRKPSARSLLTNAIRLLKEGEFEAKSLKIHKLKGDLKDRFAFSLTYDLRVIFRRKGNLIIFVNIGSHDEVY